MDAGAHSLIKFKQNWEVDESFKKTDRKRPHELAFPTAHRVFALPRPHRRSVLASTYLVLRATAHFCAHVWHTRPHVSSAAAPL